MGDNEFVFRLLFLFCFLFFGFLMDDTGLIKSNPEISIAYKVFLFITTKIVYVPCFFNKK